LALWSGGGYQHPLLAEKMEKDEVIEDVSISAPYFLWYKHTFLSSSFEICQSFCLLALGCIM
jgi:hypothetical protein